MILRHICCELVHFNSRHLIYTNLVLFWGYKEWYPVFQLSQYLPLLVEKRGFTTLLYIDPNE